MTESMITTIDNPYDPFTQFDDWLDYDAFMGYHTPEYLARVCFFSEELSQADQDLAIDTAIDEIVNLNVLGLYKKVTREIPTSKEPVSS